jgi:GT2 family glycosyltransferase
MRLPVCVVIPAYNRAAELGRCLASVWAQRPYLPAEVIVVDDHSTDDTAAVAASLGARVIRHEENRGPAQARNTALRATDCEWVAFLDSDDEWLPRHLAHLWEIRGGHALVGAAAYYLTSEGCGDRFAGPVTRRPMQFASSDRLISTLNFFTTSGSMVRREAAIDAGGFGDWWGAEDFDLWLRVLEHHTAICSREVTVLYHIHPEQLSRQAERMRAEHRKVVRAHIERTGHSAAMLERWEGTVAWDAFRAAAAAGDRCAAFGHLRGVVANRQRMIGVATQVWLRVRSRRRSSRLGPDGSPSIALVVGDCRERQAVLDALDGRSVRDLSALTPAKAALTLLRHPAGVAVTASRLSSALVRLTGTPTVPARRAQNGALDRR